MSKEMNATERAIALFLMKLPDNITKVNGRWLYDGKWLFADQLIKAMKR